uniref:Polypeptide N-acetylgalactosaminyltransferase n=1 Tax=Strongyloides papillosus TaxID=174720 RepID=A0A0N5C4C4_STREA
MSKFVRYVPKKKLLSFFIYGIIFVTLLLIGYKVTHTNIDNLDVITRTDLKLMAKYIRNEALAGRGIGENPFKEYIGLPKIDWHDYKQMEEDMKREGNGEQGKAYVISNETPDNKKLQDQLYRANGYNAYISDMISVNRSVKDIRHPKCKEMKYISKLPTVTVIFPFFNEHKSVILRSIYSILNRSPSNTVVQIILVNDGSTKEELNEPFNEDLKRLGLSDIVEMIINKKREGLIRARQVGAYRAFGEILVFLDAHSEANYNWLPPLVEPIILNYKTVVCPFVDVISCDTFEYRAQDEGGRGSFDWSFNYKRLPLRKSDVENPTKPFYSPVMAGGYFAISAKWFWELGGYDDGLYIWGGEQYELSFKVWQCHGSLVDAPCSRIAHIYRCKYVPFPNPGIGDFISKNYKRVAVVWMDEYAKHLYDRRPAVKTIDPGDLTKQKEIRTRHKCKSFDWFMKNVAYDQDKYYPAVEPEDTANGTIKNLGLQLCMDATNLVGYDQLRVAKCGGVVQYFSLYYANAIRLIGGQDCLDASSSKDGTPVILYSCHGQGGNQRFHYDLQTKQIIHKISGNCLEASADKNGGGNVFTSTCKRDKMTQKWKFTYVNRKLVEERKKLPDRE